MKARREAVKRAGFKTTERADRNSAEQEDTKKAMGDMQKQEPDRCLSLPAQLVNLPLLSSLPFPLTFAYTHTNQESDLSKPLTQP